MLAGIKNRKPPSPKHRQGGLTLVELLATLVIAAILLGLAVPSLETFIARQRMSAAVNDFIADLHFARSDAVKRMSNVIICPSSSGTDCNGDNSSWHTGWITYLRDDATVLRQHGALPNGFSVRTDGDRLNIMYQGSGTAAGTTQTILFCYPRNTAVMGREVVINNAGRVFSKVLDSSCS